MIVPMKKITMVILNKDRENFLLRLRSEGVLHIKHLAKPASADIIAIEETESRVRRAISALPVTKDLTKQKAPFTINEENLIQKAKEIASLSDEKEELDKKTNDIKNSLVWYIPWGGFNPDDISFLKEHGIDMRLYILNKSDSKKIEDNKNIIIINRDSNNIYAAAFFYGVEDKTVIPGTEIKPPLEKFADLETKLNDCNSKIKEIQKSLEENIIFMDGLNRLLSTLEKKHKFFEVFYGMRHEDGFSILQGFCPAKSVKNIISLAEKNSAGYLMEEPDNPEETPTLIKNPKWLRIIDPVFKFLNTLPGYNEFDISPVFLLFFSIFFAIIVGDAGYGLLFCVATWFIRRKTKNIPPEPFRLMYVLSFATLFWGTVTGTWFGFEEIGRLPVLNSFVIEKIGSFSENSQNYVIFICFIIGVIHLSIAHSMKFIRTINSIQSIAQIGWILILWGLFFLAGTLVINRQFPEFAKYLLIAGVSIVLLFSNFQKNIVIGILISLRDVPLSIAGSFGDIVSYLRLFAVGSASVAVAGSFNEMAMNIGFNSILSGLFAALILFAAHTLNITLSFLGIIVHGVRLNMLEFSGHLGVEWSGNRYSPFSESN